MENTIDTISVIGAGGWGTTLAILLANNKFNINLWTYNEKVINEISVFRTNSKFLPNEIKIPLNVNITNNVNELTDSKFFIIAVPTQYIREILTKYDFPFQNKPIINAAKGIERNTLFRVSEILSDVAKIGKNEYGVLTGPSHAEEVVIKIPTSVVLASKNKELPLNLQKYFTNSYFRVYASKDVIGCEIGGALKNVIAIASGIIDGLGMGDNIKAALITRGLAEMSRLGKALGAKHKTFSGLSGLGDLFVTCNSKHSRNRRVGELIGQGKTVEEITRETEMVAEGITTTESAYRLSQKVEVEMPIVEQMFQIIFNNKHPLDAIQSLMSRSHKKEWW